MKEEFISKSRMEQMTTVSSSKSKYFVIFILSTTICLILLISLLLFTTVKSRQSSSSQISMKLISKQTTTSTTTTTTFSPEELRRLSAFKEFLNLPNNHPNPNPAGSTAMMNRFMRSVYQEINDETDVRRRKRQTNILLSDQTDFIISLPNHSLTKDDYLFEYNSSLEYLSYAELILPINHRSNIDISSSTFNISINQSIPNNQNWLKINLTEYIRSFPLKFHLSKAITSGFLTLYFHRPSHSITRREFSSFYDNQLVTYPDDPSYCQVRPLRTSFSELNWSSWILEPRSYEMNICSGTCHTRSDMGTYFLIQNLLNQKYPRKIPAPCCKPKRFSSTILLYYDGPNLILKRHENMRVVECGCSS